MKELIQSYLNWLNQKFSIQEVNGFFEINTPFVNHVNDYIQIYVKQNENGSYLLTDDGETISNLELGGLEINTASRKRELEIILNGFGVILKNNKELTALADAKNFPKKKHNFLQAILAIDDLHVLSQPRAEQFFLEDVILFLQKNEVRFSQNIVLQGRSTFQHKFDILIPSSSSFPERIIKVIPNPKKQNVIPYLFAFEDTKKERNNEGIMILNDIEHSIASDVFQAISEYNIFEMTWTEREKKENRLRLVA